MATRTITVHDRCTVPDCNRVLHSIREGEMGVCSSCWFASLKPETKGAINKLIASAFNGSTEEQKGSAVSEAMKRLDGERYAYPVRRCEKCQSEMAHERQTGYRCPRGCQS